MSSTSTSDWRGCQCCAQCRAGLCTAPSLGEQMVYVAVAVAADI